MNSSLASAIVAVSLIAASFVGARLRRLLPDNHLTDETKDTVRLATGLIATMSALLLGLLVSSAKSSYDTAVADVAQLASKMTLLDRTLEAYGPDATVVRDEFTVAARHAARQIWPGHFGVRSQLEPNATEGNAVYFAILRLSPRDEIQTALKQDALKTAMDMAEIRSLLQAQSTPSISLTMLIIVVLWLVVIFMSFGLFSPPNTIASLALVASAISVGGAIFILMELDSPFGGILSISIPPAFHTMLN